MAKIRNHLRMTHIFAILMSVIMSVSMLLTFLIIFILLKFSSSPLTGVITSSSFIAITCVIVGTLISTYVANKILRPIMNIDDAAKKVAKGDFSVRLDERSKVKEIKEIAENFNIMVKELSNTETLRNDFVSNVSHEFKTPLSAIEGYATLLQDASLKHDEQEKYINFIIENTQRLTTLTHNILSLSRIENQEILLQKEWFMLDEQIRRVLLGFETKWEEKGLTIDLNLDAVYFFGSKSLLAQVWSNLIDNAIKFSKQNGVLSIDCYMEEYKVFVNIKDNGVGMEEDVKKRAFDKFYQGERSHSVKGNGLGLALVNRILVLCEGQVTLDSEKGVGTKATVVLENKQKS